MSENKPFYRTIRSFVKREGKITAGQQNAIDELWGNYGVDLSDSEIDFEPLFGRNAETVLEIGFGNGLSLAEMAEVSPDTNFLGIEVHKPGVGSLLVQVKKRDLKNVRVSGEDAVELLKQIPQNSIDRLQIFFPDPWHKKRHHKRRLIQSEFVQEVVKRLKVGGVLHVATDWENYAEHVMEVLQENADLENQSSADDGFSTKPDYRPETKYERRGLNLGHGVWDLLFEKKR
jgi:tRNA (guanine-N7-)-methyltransferase